MRTTLDLPAELLEEGMQITKERNKTSLIVNSIKSMIRKHKLLELIREQGTLVDLNLDVDKLRKRKR